MVRLQSLGLFHVWTSGENANKDRTASDFGLERIHSASHMDVNTHMHTHTHTHTGSGRLGTFKPYSLISYLVTVSIALSCPLKIPEKFCSWAVAWRSQDTSNAQSKLRVLERHWGVGWGWWGVQWEGNEFCGQASSNPSCWVFFKKGFLNLICIEV